MCGSISILGLRNSHGILTLAIINDKIMTPPAIKIAKSRVGKGEPSGINRGKVKTPAKVTAPRTPATDIINKIRQLIWRAVCWVWSTSQVKRITSQPQINRKAISAVVISNTANSNQIIWECPASCVAAEALANKAGNCSPNKTKSTPFKTNLSISQIVRRCRRVKACARPLASL